jgi:hypothetical protein
MIWDGFGYDLGNSIYTDESDLMIA